MKKLTIIIAILISCWSYGQTINNKKIENINSEYITVLGINESKGAWIRVDYGQTISNDRKDSQRIMGGDREMLFNSLISCVNYFSKYCYEIHFFDSGAVSGGSKVFYTYLLKKTKDENG